MFPVPKAKFIISMISSPSPLTISYVFKRRGLTHPSMIMNFSPQIYSKSIALIGVVLRTQEKTVAEF